MARWIQGENCTLINLDKILYVRACKPTNSKYWHVRAFADENTTENESFCIANNYESQLSAYTFVQENILYMVNKSYSVHLKQYYLEDLYKSCNSEIEEQNKIGSRLVTINFSNMESDDGLAHAFLVFEDRN